jgi:hypothetical protein
VIGDRHSATVRVTLALVRSALVVEPEAVADEGADDFAGREGAECSRRDVRHTATKGSSETATSAGTGLPSSASSPTISTTSRIFASASRGYSPTSRPHAPPERGRRPASGPRGFDDDAEGIGGHAILLGFMPPLYHIGVAPPSRRMPGSFLSSQNCRDIPRAVLCAAKHDEGVYRLHSLT